MNYSSTSVDWANFVREPFKLWVMEHMMTMKFSGIVEIDESKFGRRMKYHRGELTYDLVKLNAPLPLNNQSL